MAIGPVRLLFDVHLFSSLSFLLFTCCALWIFRSFLDKAVNHMTKIHIRGLVPKISEPFHGLVMVRFASPLSPEDRTRAEAHLCEVGGLTEIPPEETTEEESLFVTAIYPGVDESGISVIRETLQDFARDFGAVNAVFAVVPTEIDGRASQQSDATDEDEVEKEVDENEVDEKEESPVKSVWKAGPPPGVESVPFHLERYPVDSDRAPQDPTHRLCPLR